VEKMTQSFFKDLNGKTALITGGLGYLGRELCAEFAMQGTNLIVLDKDRKDVDLFSELQRKGVKVDFWNVDFESRESRAAVIEKISTKYCSLDILINNAAYVGSTNASGWAVPFEDQSISTWNKALEVNLTTPFHLVQGFEKILRNSNAPAIVNIGSIYGSHGPDWELYKGTDMGNPAGYAASKGGLIQLTRWLATTLSPAIRVNCVSPGGIERNQETDFVERYENRTPLKRMATEKEIVSAILFLSSSSASYITGQNIHVDGGWTAW
jgi:NAD(P)-dependent dehydrogenase (short-subunit alcohol dehydrogenase family)